VTADQAQCIAQQAHRFEVPELLLHAIRRKEGGKLGDNIPRRFGNSRDMGPSQINSIWLSHFRKYGVGANHLIGDFCVNIQASAYVLKTYYYKHKGSWPEAIISYNIGPYKQTPERRRIGVRYMRDVMADWNQLYRYATANQVRIACYYADPKNAPEQCRASVAGASARSTGVFEAPAPDAPASEPSASAAQ